MSPAQRIRVSTGAKNRLETGTVPIVVVPGFLATRLNITVDNAWFKNKAWDPDSSTTMFRTWILADAKSFRFAIDPRNPATVMTEGHYTNPESDRGWNGPAREFYGGFLEFLDRLSFGTYRTPVYAVGYDWRQTNPISARFLANRIEEILRNERAEKCIIVTHSMGGLVSRYALRHISSLAEKVLGAIHIAQPVSGSVVMYRRLITGMLVGVDGGAFSALLGFKTKSFSTIASAIPSSFQLLPTNDYIDPSGQPWMRERSASGEPGVAREGDVWSWYRSSLSPPSVIGQVGQAHYLPEPQFRRDLRRNIDRAEKFHQHLGLFKHPNTWAIYGDDVDTDVRFEITVEVTSFGVRRYRYSSDAPNRSDEGDGTVPVASANRLFPEQAYRYDPPSKMDFFKQRQWATFGDEHAAICNEQAVGEMTARMIGECLATFRMTL